MSDGPGPVENQPGDIDHPMLNPVDQTIMDNMASAFGDYHRLAAEARSSQDDVGKMILAGNSALDLLEQVLDFAGEHIIKAITSTSDGTPVENSCRNRTCGIRDQLTRIIDFRS